MIFNHACINYYYYSACTILIIPIQHITSNGGLPQFEETEDDFGTFKTTFADTKV